jgi:hypothetical protein
MQPLGGNPNDVPLTSQEKQAIVDLKTLAKRWPKSLWLFTNGTCNIMRTGNDGERVYLPSPYDGVDPDYYIDTLDLPTDGGDW